MRKLFLAPLFVAGLGLAPLAAMAQPASPPAAPGAPPAAQGGMMSETMTRDQFIARASDRAGKLFDAVDVNHTGSITREQMREYMRAHRHERMQPPQ